VGGVRRSKDVEGGEWGGDLARGGKRKRGKGKRVVKRREGGGEGRWEGGGKVWGDVGIRGVERGGEGGGGGGGGGG